jgi:hypothetical protein
MRFNSKWLVFYWFAGIKAAASQHQTRESALAAARQAGASGRYHRVEVKRTADGKVWKLKL